jgi:hypothetical protein
MTWNVSVSVRLTLDYDDIEADTEEEAKDIAKEKADEDLWFDNATFDGFSSVIAWSDEEEDDQAEEADSEEEP